ncbi:hypothetical protein ACLK2F_13605 [Escherichia coli]
MKRQGNDYEHRYALKGNVLSEHFYLGSLLVTLGSYMINTLHFTGANVGMVYSSKGIAAIIMPGIWGSSYRPGCAQNVHTCCVTCVCGRTFGCDIRN